jgi:hypothetical protein
MPFSDLPKCGTPMENTMVTISNVSVIARQRFIAIFRISWP